MSLTSVLTGLCPCQEAVDMLLSGKFWWFFRRRLRISLTGDPAKISLPPIELKEQQLQYPEYRYMDLMNETGCDHPFKETESEELRTVYTQVVT